MSNKKIERASWDENIQHYNANKVDWVVVGATAFFIGLGLVALLVLY